MLSGHTINTHTYTLIALTSAPYANWERQTLHGRLKVDTYGTQHFGSEVSKRHGAHKLPGGDKNVAWALSRSKLNRHLLVKLFKVTLHLWESTRGESEPVKKLLRQC